MDKDVIDTDVSEKDSSVDVTNTSNVKSYKFNKVFTKATIFWFIYFILGIGLSIFCRFRPIHIEISVNTGIAVKTVIEFLAICSVKYIWIISLLCIFFMFKRKDNSKYFSFIVGFYSLLLILGIMGVVF